MAALKHSDFFIHFKGHVFLSQFEAVAKLKDQPPPSASDTAATAPTGIEAAAPPV